MNGMHELVFLLADNLPEEAILEMVTEALAKHKADNTAETKSQLLSAMSMFMTKAQIDRDGIEKMRKEFAELATVKNMFSEERKS